jgi:predicted metal-dependent hydrolase
MPLVQIAGLPVELVRKNIRSLRLTVYAPDGRIRVAAPLRTPEAAIHAFVSTRRAWIQKHQQQFEARAQPAAPMFQTGEIHFYQGRPYSLELHPAAGPTRVQLHEEAGTMALHLAPGSTPAQREKALSAWYRARLKEQLPALIAQWEAVVGVQVQAWGVKQMKTRWGTCSIRARRIWLNLELIKKPPHCLEYVVVHELVHLHERLHNARWGLMDGFMPDWRTARQELKSAQLAPCG